jgi:hypothetical protein
MPTKTNKTGARGAKKSGAYGAKKKTGTSSAAKKTGTSRRKSSSLTLGVDPPIIVDGGGLGGLISLDNDAYVIIKSALPLVAQGADGDYPYVYRIDVDIKWMNWQGAGHKKDKSKDGKKFTLELHHTDEPS